MEHIISLTVENKFGSLSRVAGLFSGRGFNIESLSVAPTLDPSVSMMTLVTSGDDRIIEQIMKQLNKVIDVIKVVDISESEFVERETALIKSRKLQQLPIAFRTATPSNIACEMSVPVCNRANN